MTRRVLRWLTAALGVAILTWAVPLFHVVPLDTPVASGPGARIDPAGYAQQFWDERLMASTTAAADARSVLDAIAQDAGAARTRYGRTVGISSAYYVSIRGSGRIVALTPSTVSVAIGDDATHPDVLLPRRMVFGNAVRDASGLLTTDDVPDSQTFNAISTELNRLVETRVLPALNGAAVGRMVRFVGCARVSSDPGRRFPLKVVPLRAEIVADTAAAQVQP